MQSQMSLSEGNRGRFEPEGEGNATTEEDAFLLALRWKKGPEPENVRYAALVAGKDNGIDSPPRTSRWSLALVTP